MFSFFKSRGHSRSLDDYLTRYLTAHYGVTANQLENLRYVTSKRKLDSRNVTTFRIFDPSLVGDLGDRTSYADLDDHQGALQFEGTFASNKTVTEIKDMRTRG